ncbi:hypothetical protein [Saccharothrix saharensis]|uniref:hypothetical protein n=1 Tax=Saccharothrix saharensis TaxID=571190 RepID=UPI00114D7674|nr:hypothetical protein [Saccharothrix saharensis]
MSDERFTRGHVITSTITSLIGIGVGWWFSGVAAVVAGSTALAAPGIVIALVLTGWVVRFGRSGRALPPGGRRSDSPFGPGYGIAVLVMLVAIVAGSRLPATLDLAEATPAWVLVAVGAHFAPFAKLFGSARYLVPAAALCGTAVLAAVPGAAGSEWAWRLVPGFGGAAVLWATVVAGLLDGRRSVAAHAV